MKTSKYTSQSILIKLQSITNEKHFMQIQSFYQTLVNENKSPLTIKSYLQDIYTAIMFFKNYQALPENLPAWREFFKARYRTIKPQSQRKLLASIKAFARHCEDKTLENVLNQIALPKTGLRHPKTLSLSQTQELLNLENKNPTIEARDQAIFYLLYGCGVRISECLGIKLSDITPTEITVTGKGNKIRQIPLLPNVYEKIQNYLVLRPQSNTEQIFLDTKAKPLTRHQVAKRMSELKQILGLPDHTTPHALRHSFVSHLIENQASLKAIQNLVGHASLSTIQNYSSVSIKHLAKAHNLGVKSWEKTQQAAHKNKNTD